MIWYIHPTLYFQIVTRNRIQDILHGKTVFVDKTAFAQNISGNQMSVASNELLRS
ncbi:MAG: hypothetical protein IPM34_01870 [Saprospiraceae bacterium]|nr:hypothetical protein [Saprospiraceae bacterium]